jgi:hypothetical protein
MIELVGVFVAGSVVGGLVVFAGKRYPVSRSWVRYRADWLVDGRWLEGEDFESREQLTEHVNEVSGGEECDFLIVEVTTTVAERVL